MVGIEPTSGPYKEPALTVELQACGSWRSLGPEGFEPSPCELKVRCAAVTPRPRNRSRYLFMSLSLKHCLISVE